MNVYKKFTAKPHSFLVIYMTLASDNPSCFRKYLSETIKKLIMTIDNKTMNKKQQFNINRKSLKYQHFTEVKLMNMNILQMTKRYHLIKIE